MAYPQTAFASTVIDPNSLIGNRRQAVSANTLLYQLDVLKKTGRYDAFRLKWHPTYDEPPLVWPIPNHQFWDSDVAKWIEGACYFLKQQPLPEIDSAVQELVEMIRSAQQPDGYLNIHYTVVEPGKRFTNLRDMHELYNAGHLIEAALAHNDLYHNDRLMEPILKYVDLLDATFGPAACQLHGYPGHPEIELALLRLHDRTRNPKHLASARYFITERGNPKGVDGHNYFDWESLRRGDDPIKKPAYYPEPRSLWYHQAHEPIIDQQTIEGHSVRAVYLLIAVADLLRVDNDRDHANLKTALYRLWDNMVDRKMYVTGGIGAIKQWEGFGREFFLPQGTDEGGCYSETCAAIGVMMLAQRFLEIDPDSRFGDIMELCLYNAVLTSMSHDGKAFTYVNQLASSDEDLAKRSDWFTVACCPPNILRLLGQIGGYVWTHQIDHERASATLIANLYVPSTYNLSLGDQSFRISQQGQWPWDDTISFKVEGTATAQITIKLRIPAWAPGFTLEPNCPEAVSQNGYLTLSGEWLCAHPSFRLIIPLQPRWIAPHPLTGQDTVSLARGAVIYCVEDYNNSWVQDHFKTTFVDTGAPLVEEETVDAVSEDRYVSITLKEGARTLAGKEVHASPFVNFGHLQKLLGGAPLIPELKFVPYCFRANRGGRGHMRVGLRRYL